MRRNLFAIFTIAAVLSGVLAPIQSYAGPTATPGKSQGNGPCVTSGNTNSQTQSTKNTNKQCLLAAPAFILSSSSETREVNTAAIGFTINSTGGIASFAINTTPPGMNFNNLTGALTGTPNTVAAATDYTVTATNATGIARRTFTLTVTAAPIVISAAAIAGVTAPVTGETPVSTTTAGTGYTGTVTWSGSPATFASGTIYTATITLTATSGYTLTGVSANFFTVAGATSVTNSANAGVITAVFYMVGATGPGGGTIFYAATTPFVCGPTLASSCTYLEAAPTSGINAWTDDRYLWSGTSEGIGATAQGVEIGTGFKNTLAMIGQTNAGTSGAGSVAQAFRGPNNLMDWFLPSIYELDQLYLRKADRTVGGFEGVGYWSSSEFYPNYAMYRGFFAGSSGAAPKNSFGYVRPVRAF